MKTQEPIIVIMAKFMEFKEPWSMTYLEYVDAIIDQLKERLGHTHPLFSKDVFVAAVSNELDAALLEIGTGKSMEYAVLYYHGKGEHQKDGTVSQPELIYLSNRKAVQSMIDTHHREWLLKYTQE